MIPSQLNPAYLDMDENNADFISTSSTPPNFPLPPLSLQNLSQLPELLTLVDMFIIPFASLNDYSPGHSRGSTVVPHEHHMINT